MSINKAKLIDAIFESGGALSVAATTAGCSLQTIYNHRDRDPDVAEAITIIQTASSAERIDLAESKLSLAVDDGQWWAIKYVLSTKGKSRGYTTRTRLDQSQVKQIILQVNTGETPAPE